MKKYALILSLLLIVACSKTRNGYVKGIDFDANNNSYSVSDLNGEEGKKSLEDIIVFDEEGVSIRRDGKNLILSMPELILFDFNKYDIKNAVKPSLSALARALEENRDIFIKIDGYTDFIGTESYNLELSVKRARAIKNFLVSRGVVANNVSIEGYGEQNPLASNETAYGRSKNRRVEFIISRR